MLGLCNYFLSFTWPLVIIFFNTFACLLKSHKPKSDNIVQLKIAICVWSFTWKTLPKTVRHLNFPKSILLSLFFIFLLCQRRFLQDLQFGFDGFFGVYREVLGVFWWVTIMVLTEMKYTSIYEEDSDRASNKVF